MIAQTNLSVFLSYSRDDLEIATQLIYSLQAFGFHVTVDHEAIQGGELWQERLRQLIIEADCVIFALSPTSVESTACKWEVDTALALSKRIIPAVVAPLEGGQPHKALRDLNHVYFYAEPAVPSSGFGKGLGILVDALTQDLDWIRRHTQLIETAEQWSNQRSSDRLLRGTELDSALSWRVARPANAPALTQLQIEFLNASEEMQKIENNARNQRLAELQKALEDREEAQQARVKATKRLVGRTYIGIALAVVLTSIAMYQWRSAVTALRNTEFEQILQDRMLDFIGSNRDLPKSLELGTLAQRYEGQKSDNVSSELDFGHFYGVYRIRAGSDEANMKEFLVFIMAARQRAIFDKLYAAGGLDAASQASPDFVAAWKGLAQEAPTKEIFERLQRAFVAEVDYGRIVQQLRNPRNHTYPGINFDLRTRSKSLQAVLFSVVVQYGPSRGVELVRTATAQTSEPASLSDRDLIDLIYAERDNVDRYFPKIATISKRYKHLIELRNKWEKQDAVFMLDMENNTPNGQ